jgi:hypothetical protein
MARSSKIRHDRLAQLEAEFKPLLLSCLRECAAGRYGLFGHNDHLDPQHRFWNWPEAQNVVEMADKIQALRLEAGESNFLAERLLYFRSLRGSNVPGEPKMAKKLLDEFALGSSEHE